MSDKNQENQVVGPAAKVAPEVDKPICILILGEDNSKVKFRMRTTTLLGKVKLGWCKRMALDPKGLRFRFDGVAVNDDDTPNKLRMVDDDVIEVYSFQAGG